jgi:Fe-S cluster biosynthesis and repair protein YggX
VAYSPAMSRMVKCVKLHQELPGMPYKPFEDELGQRIYDTVSFDAWRQWVEHSKMIVNEYRLDLTSKKAHDVLREQCRKFFFDEGESESVAPPDFVPPKS